MKEKKGKTATTQTKPPQTEPAKKVRHPDADYVQKTTFGYIGAYA